METNKTISENAIKISFDKEGNKTESIGTLTHDEHGFYFNDVTYCIKGSQANGLLNKNWKKDRKVHHGFGDSVIKF